jgi:hypothetical protein
MLRHSKYLAVALLGPTKIALLMLGDGTIKERFRLARLAHYGPHRYLEY